MGKTMSKAPRKPKPGEPARPEVEMPLEFFGTWEEIQKHTYELAGKTVHVTVLPEHGRILSVEDLAPLPDSISLAGAFSGRLGEFCLGQPELSTRTGERFAKLIAEKYSEEHL